MEKKFRTVIVISDFLVHSARRKCRLILAKNSTIAIMAVVLLTVIRGSPLVFAMRFVQSKVDTVFYDFLRAGEVIRV